ncbi:MAG: family 20 glycosylhydrolase [Ignavibacteria bacterium]|nr:family 20 glycosylhydrolase [Ignavibacteria bacterium]MCU7500285.1 family 20 glycosylhydrolase [Ignavibacteria bacterium]MCU7513803.1 family 20 glycosylhydrolase [Ignavibacteria bacterium]
MDTKLNLMPMPAKISLSEGKFRLTPEFAMSVKGSPNERLYPYATRILRRLSGRTGLFFQQDFITKASQSDTVSFYINCQRPGEVKLNEDESYTLEVTPGKVTLNATDDLGALRGLETFVQLLSVDQDGYYIPCMKIEDNPRFQWRGLMMDAARHFMPVDVVKRNIDGMAAVKMNVFHWHLSDDQGFRVELKTIPELTKIASDGLYYTQEEIREVLQYANDRGIRVIPEFDIPGHSTSYLAAFPELASAPGPYKVERRWGVFDPTFNPTIEATYTFFDKFFAEVTKIFPDPYMHIGGDENNGKQWNTNPEIQQFMKKNNIPNNHALQAYFNKRILQILTKYGKKMIGWDEIQQPDLPKNIVIQSWRGQKGLADAAKAGFQVILSNGYYIDLIQPTDFHYLNDPIPANSPLTEDEKKLVMGGEVTQWAELVTPENVDSRIWPRTAAIAERFWSPQSVNDVEDMYRRMDAISPYLEELGLMHIKNQGMMLRRLSNYADTTPLKTFVDVVEPVKLYARHSQGVKYTQYSPYTRLVDAAVPDPKTVRDFRKLVDSFLKTNDDASYNALKMWLTLWKENHKSLLTVINQSPVLKEIESMSSDLSELSQTGLTALETLHSGKSLDKSWQSEQASLIERAKKPRGQAEIMVVPAIERLISPDKSFTTK